MAEPLYSSEYSDGAAARHARAPPPAAVRGRRLDGGRRRPVLRAGARPPDGEGRARDGDPRRRAARRRPVVRRASSARCAMPSTAACRSASSRRSPSCSRRSTAISTRATGASSSRSSPGGTSSPCARSASAGADVPLQVDANAAYSLADGTSPRSPRSTSSTCCSSSSRCPRRTSLGHAELAQAARDADLPRRVDHCRRESAADAIALRRLLRSSTSRPAASAATSRRARVHDVCRARGRAGVVRRDARDRARPRGERRARRAARLHPAGRHVGAPTATTPRTSPSRSCSTTGSSRADGPRARRVAARRRAQRHDAIRRGRPLLAMTRSLRFSGR